MSDPKQDSVLLAHAMLDGSHDDRWVSTKDLADVSAAQLGDFHHWSWAALVDKQAIYSLVGSPSHESTVMVQADGQAARAICDGAFFAPFGQGLLLVLKKPAASYEVVNMLGQEIYETRHGIGSDRILAASGAARENRIAFVYGALRNSLFDGWSASNHIIVVDADLKSETKLPSAPDRGSHSEELQVFHPVALALSPDGRTLGIAMGGSLALWRVP